jgi:hypothetical protein
MVSHPPDYKVARRSERQIMATAERLRVSLEVDNNLEFNPLDAVRWFHRQEIPGKGLLRVVPFEAPRGAKRARVKYKPLRLMIDRPIWEAAIEEGDPEARFILNHEIGHMIMHDHNAKAFSSDDADRLTAWPREYLAEWQADTFADHVSLPWKFIASFDFDPAKIALFCNVPRAVALRQIDSLRSSRNYSGDMCPFCGNFTLVHRNYTVTCDTCKKEIACS